MSRSELHVAICTDGVFPHAMGGMQRHSRLLAEHLAKSGRVRLTVLHPHEVGVFDPAFGIDEVHVAPIDTDRIYLRELWKYSGRVGEELDRLRPDVIFSQGFCVWQGITRYSDRLIVHPHGLEMFQGLSFKERVMGAPFRALLRYVVRRSSVVVSLGGKLTALLQGVTRGSKCRVVVIPNAVDMPDGPTIYPVEATPLRLLFVGRFAFNKGLDVLLSVARRFDVEGRLGDVLFELAGDGPLMENMRRDGVPRNVRVLGRVDDALLAQLYHECHALVLPTRFEGMPTVVLEAMAHARPVLVSDVGATAELVDRTNGYLLRAGDAQELYDAVRDLCARPLAERRAMGAHGQQRVLSDFTWPVIVQRFVSLFGEPHASGK
ncbi:MAG: glycosyltransferase family 4 protein [Flavobacteriales bacterium]